MKKQRSEDRESEGSEGGDRKGSMVLDEGTIMVVGLGLDSERKEVYIEYVDDPRFINNPHGIGCSRTYEMPHGSSLSSSPASTTGPARQGVNANESDGVLPFPNLGQWKPDSIDMVKGKRKGRMPGDGTEDRYSRLRWYDRRPGRGGN